MVLLNDLIDVELPEVVELTEELVNAESKGQGDLYDVILKNPTPRELKQYNQDWWRVTVTKDGNFWFAYMYDWVHNDLIDWLVSNEGYEFDSEVARIIFYDFKMTPLLNIVVDSHEEMEGYRNERSEEDIQAEYNNKLNIIKNSNYIRTNFPKALYKLERRDEEADDMYETLNEEVKPELNDNFWKWFGNSKTIKNGEPMIFYHGTPNSFTTFDIEKSSPYGIVGQGFYFTDSQKTAENYVGGILDRKTENSHVKSCYLRMINPYNLSDVITDDEIASLAKLIKKNNDDFWYKKILDDADRSYDEDEYPEGFMFEEGWLVNPKAFNRQSLQNAINWLYKAGVIKNNNLIRDNVWWIMTDGYHTNSSKRELKKWLFKNGYDSVIYQIIGDNKGNGDWVNNCYVVFNSNQIKSVNNKGLYSLENNDINEQLSEMKESVEPNKKVVAYHGSQTDNLQFHQGRALYLTDNYDLAKELALKDGDGGLYDGEIATVYTCRLDIKKSYETYSEAEYERYFVDTQLDRNYWLNKGYDSIIVHPTEVSQTTYYIMLNPEESVKIIKKEIFEDGELMDEILIESSNTNEYKNEFESRVEMHKSLVNKYAQRVGLTFPQHDIDKFEKPLSNYYWLDMKSNYEPLSDKEKANLRKAGMFHRINNPHHPEFWDKANIQNMTDIKSDPIKPFNVQSMSEDAMIEMCADWCAMSEEFGNTPFEWFEYVNGNRYIFNSIQKEFIEDVLAQMWNNGYGSSANSEDDDINEIIELGRLYG